MKDLRTVLEAIKFSSFESPSFGTGPEWAWTQWVEKAINRLNYFDLSEAMDYSDYPEGFDDYSAKAKRSLNSAGKKCAKLLEKILKPKFEGKTNKTIEELKSDFYIGAKAFFVEDAWEWAPMAGTDAMENYWDSYTFFVELQHFFDEMSDDEYEEIMR